MEIPRNIDYNYAYFFLLFDEGKNKRDKIYEALKIKKINCRKYWYPLITEHPMYINANLKNAKHLSEKILALPIYPFLEPDTQNVIIETINGSLS